MTDLAQGPPAHDDRIVGWKSIAAHLQVSQRTAIRWSDTYALPVHRIARGNRPFVFAIREELDAWARSADAARAIGEEGCQVAAEPNPSPVAELHPEAGGQGNQRQASLIPATNDGQTRRPKWLPRWRLAAAGVVVLAACAIAAWRLPATTSGGTLAWRISRGARGEALSQDRVILEVALAGQTPSTVGSRPGDMIRVETAALHLGLQTRYEGDRLRVVVHRLEGVPSGEVAVYLFTRDLILGQRQRLQVEGRNFDVTWIPTTAQSGGGDASVPLHPCCVVCKDVTVCGQTVVSACGHCQGRPRTGG